MKIFILLLLVPTGAMAAAAEQPLTNTTLDVDYIAAADYADGRDQLDIYMPAGAKGAPVLVYFHGGALMYGDKSQAQAVAKRLSAQGIGLVSANYRFSPGVMHPAHVQDAAAATAWVYDNIANYGGDPKKLYVGGHSAGAYLAALLALDPQHLQRHDMALADIQGAIPISPFLYVEETAKDRPKSVWGDVPANWLKASVTPHIKAGKPPMLLIYADGDDPWRAAQNQKLARELTLSGNKNIRAIEVPNRNHVSLIAEIDAADDQIVELVADFIGQHTPCHDCVRGLARLQDRTVDLASVQWIHGVPDCESAQAAVGYLEWQKVQYQNDTYIFRQNKCSNYEAPFVYLFVGAERALLIDTGATVGGGSSLATEIREITNLPVVVAHSHGHGDHRSGDASLQSLAGFTVVSTGPDAVQEFFKFAGWPMNPATLELGNRRIELLPIPGHHSDDLAFYDARSKFVVTGDTLYPGRLYIGDWTAYRASISRLMSWVETKDVAYVMGTHIEMSNTPNVDYPIGTTHQPDELALPLSVSDIAKLEAKTTLMETPSRTYLGNFIIWPKD